MPTEKLLTEMGKFNEELGESRRDACRGRAAPQRERQAHQVLGREANHNRRTFTETKELVAGFWLWQVKSIEEAVEWLKRSPFDGGPKLKSVPCSKLKISARSSPELREQEERLRKQVAARK